MEDFFETFLGRSMMEPLGLRRPVVADFEGPEFRLPRVDMIDFDDHLLLRAELPGIKKDDIELSISDDSVTIAVVRDVKKEKKEERFYRYELAHGAFERTLDLPKTVDPGKAKAELKDGILEIVLPKALKENRRTLKIS
jgi:HSP20 family protein